MNQMRRKTNSGALRRRRERLDFIFRFKCLLGSVLAGKDTGNLRRQRRRSVAAWGVPSNLVSLD
eukprot:scaffold207_cov267-Pinguiococcus_pyrenoidosus.AAC.23